MKKLACVALVMVNLFGCANMQRQTTWNKSGAQTGELSQAMTECDYDVSKSANTYDNTMRSAIGQGLELGMRQNALFSKCMAVKGWY